MAYVEMLAATSATCKELYSSPKFGSSPPGGGIAPSGVVSPIVIKPGTKTELVFRVKRLERSDTLSTDGAAHCWYDSVAL